MFTPRVRVTGFAFALLLLILGSAWYSSTAVPRADAAEPIEQLLQANPLKAKIGPAPEPAKPAEQQPTKSGDRFDPAFWLDYRSGSHIFVGNHYFVGVTGQVAKKPDDKSPEKVVTTLPGVVVPARQFRVSPKVAGQVLELLIDEGTQVKAGQVLARLERTEYELEHKRALAQVDRMRALLAEEEAKGAKREEEIRQAEAAIQEAAAQLAHRKAEVVRLHALVKERAVTTDVADEKKAQLQVVEARLQQAESNLKMLQKAPQKERVAAARAALAAAEAQRDLAKFRLDSTEIRAPADGTILALHIQAGDTVRPDALVNGRSVSLGEIADLSQLEATVSVPEGDLQKVFQGQKCEIRVGAVPGAVYKGQVARVAPTVSHRDRTAAVHVRMEVPKEDRNLRPGMYTQVRLLAKE